MTLPACDRIIELAGLEPQEPFWYCSTCLRKVHPRFVTYEETHDGCGAAVQLCTEPDEWLAESRTLAPKIAAALNEAARVIEDAPHSDTCNWNARDILGPDSCSCWKQTALARINELLK